MNLGGIILDSDYEMDMNEIRATNILKKYNFNFNKIDKNEIISLIEQEISNYQEGSSEYIRVLCGYLYCIGNINDSKLIERAKYSINMDVGCMVDGEWIESLKNGGVKSISQYTDSRENIIECFIDYYKNWIK